MRRIMLFTAMVMMVLALTGCSDVFYSAVSGRLIDSDTEQGIQGVNVFAYTSESERDAAYDAYKEGTLFSDSSCLFRATTDSNGNFSIQKVIWKTDKPTWSEDYDSSSVYLIFFSEEYGLIKEGPIAIVSSSSNQNAVTLRLEKKETTSSFELSFIDSSSAGMSKKINETINFTYSYSNGYRTITRDASTSNGVYTITLSYPKGSECKVVVSNLSSPEEVFSPEDASAVEYEFTAKKPSEVGSIMMKRDKFNLGNGLSGRISVSDTHFTALSSAVVSIVINGVEYKVNAANPSFQRPTDTQAYAIADYTGLASGVMIDAQYTGGKLAELSYPVYAKDSTGTLLAEGTLLLSESNDSLIVNLR